MCEEVTCFEKYFTQDLPAAPFSLNSKHTLCCPVPLCDSNDIKAQLNSLYW